MIHRTSALAADLRRLLGALESDLRAQANAADVADALRSEYRAQRCEVDKRTTETYSSWLSARATRIAMGWLIDTVFLRFCEDNQLIREPFLWGTGERGVLAVDRQNSFVEARPDRTERDWLLRGFEHLRAESPLMVGTVTTPVCRSTSWDISDNAVGKLVEFWRARDERGRPVYDFADPLTGDEGSGRGWNTCFLGDLYQHLAEDERKTYALLRTPDFVAEFILDHTLECAVSENGLHGLRLIDPVCGSGTFIISAFRRLFDHWTGQLPDEDPWTRVRLALRSIHAVDRNPTAVAIARFRLLVAAMRAGKAHRLADLPGDLSITVACGDSLLNGFTTFDGSDASEEATSAVVNFAESQLLRDGSYDAVIGNPPYIVPRNSIERDAYRARYHVCTGLFSLTVPFTVRFFELARRDSSRPGFVGLLISNNFMKREFGRKLVEEFFPTVDLTGVVDTSGAYIPGHGTPTVMLFGRNRPTSQNPTPAVVCLRGESAVPRVASEGRVWRSIESSFRDGVSRDNAWTQRIEISQKDLHRFPWNLTDPGSAEILRRIERMDETDGVTIRVADLVARIGYFANTGSDDVFTSSPATFRRENIEDDALIPVLRGSDLRDWKSSPTDYGIMVPDGPEPDKRFPNLLRRLWPYRAALRTKDAPWYRWHHIAEMRDVHPWWIAFSWVSTHNHFVVLRDRIAPLTSAPIIRMPNIASNSDILQLAALLNSSVACFWLKHNSNRKSQQVTDQVSESEPWSVFYEFTSNRVGEFPLPPGRSFENRWTAHAEAIDEVAREIAETEPHSVVRPGELPTEAELAAARARWIKARRRLVSLQEELDWEIYERYGLIDSTDGLVAPALAVPELNPGERAFEIVLARRMIHGDFRSSWFERNGIEPVTSLPGSWPVAYRETVERRIGFIEAGRMVDRVELPEFKRRWQSVDWDSLLREETTTWILNCLETPAAWSDEESRPRLRTIAELVEFFSANPDLSRAASIAYPNEPTLTSVVRELIDGEHVPFLAALRYRPTGYKKYVEWTRIWDGQWEKETGDQSLGPVAVPPKYISTDFLKPHYWRMRGKLDVPSERFISYPISGSATELFGWAGWNHSQRAHALTAHISMLNEKKVATIELIPLLAGLLELEPWIARWHPDDLDGVAEFRISVQMERNVLEEDLLAWRPDPPKRGRPRKIT